MPKRGDYQYWLYDHHYENVGSFFDYVTGLVRRNDIRINILLIAMKGDIENELIGWSPERFSVRLKNSLPVFTLEVTKEWDQEKRTTVRAVVVRYLPNIPVYMVISDCKTSDFKDIITKLMNKHYPVISQIFITNNEMRMVFDKLKEATGYEIQVESSVSKKRIAGMNKKKESQVTYTNFPYSEVFEEIMAHDRWVQSIRYVAQKVEQKEKEEGEIRINKFSGIISRNCFFSCKRDFSPLIMTIIPMVIKLASVRHEYLRFRAESAGEPKPEPVVIKFQKDLFSDISMNKAYIDILAEMESCSISEYHTNPYIHVSILDYLDGSSYDVWVVSVNRMVIIPHFKASAASMSRLVNHIFEKINEGETEEYAKIQSAE